MWALGLEDEAIVDPIGAGLATALIHACDRLGARHVPLHQAQHQRITQDWIWSIRLKIQMVWQGGSPLT